MKIKIKDKELTLHYTIRMMILFENITGENVDFENLKSTKQLTTLLLACILASAHKEKIDLQLTYDEYIDFLDENGQYEILADFYLWLMETAVAEHSQRSEEKEDEKKEGENEEEKKAQD